MENKTKTVTLADDKALAVLNDEDRKILERGYKKLSQCRLQFKDGTPAPIENKPEELSYVLMMETCKAGSANGSLQIVNNAAAGQYWDNPDTCLAVALSQIADLAPQTPLEAMLISQMVAVNTAVGKVMQRAMLPNQTFAGKEMNLNFATKLQRTFLQQVDALEKLRGKGQQTVRVEHVTVNAGGQAIVGHVEHKPGGEG